MVNPAQFIAYVDDFLGTEKQLVGAYDEHIWQPGRDIGSKCLKLPLEIRGQLPGHMLFIASYPNSESLQFHIGIIVDATVARIDFEEGIHGNNLAGFMDDVPRFADGRPMLINGPHYHTWEENKRFVRAPADLPKLRNAIQLPEHCTDFASTFLYFCQHNNIDFPTKHTINLPPRTGLF